MTGGTLLIIGCGNLGTAILHGILSSIFSSDQCSDSEIPKLSRFIACVRQSHSVERIKKVLGPALSKHVEIEQQQQQHPDNRNNLPSLVAKADYIILGCKPNMVSNILSLSGMSDAINGKILISICAGVTTGQIKDYLNSECSIIRVMPNVAASVKQSMTVISSEASLSSEVSSVITWIFSNIGKVIYLPSSLMDTATALSGSGPGFFALLLESAVDGALAMGMSRDVATQIAAQTMKGTAELILTGEHPAILKDKVSSPGGCTVGGLAVLEDGAVRGHVAKAIREASVIASKLGSMKK
ncbi:Pyrroline-5-carboxylate reductase [Erysiphe neolycopersici]|uniref:Pyrroline-5-carboxylate reductase n=1 Tax=Erysiphe neolycopersici TaxID=212602 RepID=A0A420H937_9PEZI|nr:Pyrroline-5-carboxylate reductase [Erysiphe neolycopersici]